jgi:hypothetical protein
VQSLYDDFNGISINTSLWNVILPFSQSQITESGGLLTTTRSGTFETVAGFSDGSRTFRYGNAWSWNFVTDWLSDAKEWEIISKITVNFKKCFDLFEN